MAGPVAPGDETSTVDDYLRDIRDLRAACTAGDEARVAELLGRHPGVLDSPDRDERFTCPGSELWSPLYVAAVNGHGNLVDTLLSMGANAVPYEVAAQYHAERYGGWMSVLRDRGHTAIEEQVRAGVADQYGPAVDDGDIVAAAARGDLATVKALVAADRSRAHQADAVGNTSLHHAVAANDLAMARLLVDSGTRVDARNGDGRTPTVVALFGLHRYWRAELKPDALRLLFDNGAEYSMLVAATIGDEDRVRTLLATDPLLSNASDACCRRPLSGAVAGVHAAIVDLLLAHGANPNAKEAICQGGYSLREASGSGKTEIVRSLLAHGAIPEHWVDSSGDSMFGAHHGGHKEIVQMLYAHGGTMELQVYAAQHRIDVIAEVLRLDPSKADSVLPYGCDDGGSEDVAHDTMRLAIRYGARFEDASAWNMRWTVTKYRRVFRLLCEHGANPDLPLLGIAGDETRRYPDAETQLGHVAFLVEECGADVNCSDGEGFSPLAKAVDMGHAAIVEYLLARGATANTNAPDWARPTTLAAKHDRPGIAQMLEGRFAM